MVWPFGSTKKAPDDAQPPPPPPPDERKWEKSLVTPANDRQTAVTQWLPMIVFPLVGLGALQLYSHYLRRIPGAVYVRKAYFHKRSVFGRVTSVGDGDNFHLFHTPGGRAVGWGWLRKIPEKRRDLKDRTIAIRLAGVDAPENAHFGKPAQPYAAEALKWLSDYLLHHNVRAYVYKRDQYNRIVGTVFVRKWFIQRNVGLEMVKRGLATVYEAKTGAEFGGIKEVYEKAEAKAKRQKIGMWSGKPSEFESPRDYKRRMGVGGGD